jgi:hypothetical protein
MARLAGLHQAVRQDQDALARLVAAEGGVVAGQYWVVNGFAVHVPPAALPRLRAHPRVLSLHPVRGHEVSDAAPMGGAMLPLLADSGSVTPPLLLPIGSSTDAVNHAVADAWQILSAAQLPSKGEGARLVVFDTGIDADVHGQGVPTAHPSFATAGGSRVEVHLQAQAVNSVTRHVDVNVCQSHPSAAPPFVGTAGPHGCMWALSAPLNSLYATSLGLMLPAPNMFGSCQFWLAAPVTNLVVAGVVGADGRARGYLAIPPGFTHLEFGLQSTLLQSPVLFSNAVRVTVGGGL